MLRFIAIVAGLIFAARALKSQETGAQAAGAGGRPVTRFADGVSEEDVEQELRAKV